MSQFGNQDLLWQAFRYATAEMTAEESERFEQQLVDDPAACEALAQAVSTTEAIRLAAEARPVAQQHHGSRVATRIVVATAAACLLAAVGTLFRPDVTGSSPDTSVAESPARDEYINVWVTVDLDAPPIDWNQDESDESIELRDLMSAPENLAAGDSVPDWMFVALAPDEMDDMPDIDSDVEHN